jgi:fatty acid desaturase
MDNETRLLIRARTRRRLVFCTAVWIPYAAFVLQYAGLGGLFARPITDGSPATVAILFFCALVVGFLLLEFAYIRSREREDARGQR